MRAACGKTARAVRKGGRRKRPLRFATSPDPTCAGRRVLLAGESPAGPFQAGSVAKGGGNASLGAAAGTVRCSMSCRAGQGAHREVGSEGFAAKRRAVAECGEPVGQIQAEASLHYGGEANTWNAWTQQGVCGRHGVKAARVTPGGLVRSRSTGPGTWAYKPSGEVAGDAVREVGVAHGTQEPGKSKSPGIVPVWGGGMATQTAPSRGKGSRWTGQPARGIG